MPKFKGKKKVFLTYKTFATSNGTVAAKSVPPHIVPICAKCATLLNEWRKKAKKYALINNDHLNICTYVCVQV